MGWLFTGKLSGESIREFLQRTEFSGAKIVECSVKLRECYIAYRGADGVTRGAVALIEYRADQIGVKIIEEDVGPFYYNAPRRVLDKLDPTTDARALNWRAQCSLNNARREKLRADLTGKKIGLYRREFLILGRHPRKTRSWEARDINSGAIVHISPKHLARLDFIE